MHHITDGERRELLNFIIAISDTKTVTSLNTSSFVKYLYGKLVGDKGYISLNLFENLLEMITAYNPN